MNSYFKRVTLSIAGFRIKVQSDTDEKLAFDDGYFPFIIPGNSPNADISIKVTGKIENDLINNNSEIFNSCTSKQKLWSINKHHNKYSIITYNQQNQKEIQQIAIVDNKFKEWRIYTNPVIADSEKTGIVYPLLYPMGPLVLYYLTVQNKAIMIHASGTFDGEKGRAFIGFSGMGKSTMAGIWMNTGANIVNDDRLMICKETEDFFMYNTPMYYADTNKKEPVHAFYLINHAEKNTIRKLNGALAISRLMAFCIQHNYNSKFIEHHLSFVSEICSRLPVFELGFKPDENIVDFIKTHL